MWLEGWDAQLGAAQVGANRPEAAPTWNAGGGKVPMYVLQADHDFTAPARDSSDKLLAAFPDRVEVVTIEGAGHAMLPEQPDAIAEAVLDFLGR